MVSLAGEKSAGIGRHGTTSLPTEYGWTRAEEEEEEDLDLAGPPFVEEAMETGVRWTVCTWAERDASVSKAFPHSFQAHVIFSGTEGVEVVVRGEEETDLEANIVF